MIVIFVLFLVLFFVMVRVNMDLKIRGKKERNSFAFLSL
jgi:hypothetical protein